MKPQLLSNHFSLAEATASEEAERHNIDNTPDSNTINTMYKTADNMEIVRSILEFKPIHINSWYRCPMLNSLVGSKPTSQHIKGEAVDFICPTFGDCLAVAKKLVESSDRVQYDQLILEHTWIHISFAITTMKPRSQVLSLLSDGSYAVGLTDKSGRLYD